MKSITLLIAFGNVIDNVIGSTTKKATKSITLLLFMTKIWRQKFNYIYVIIELYYVIILAWTHTVKHNNV